MNLLTYLTLASLFSVGTYLLSNRAYGEALLGIAVLSNAVNLLILESSQDPSDPLPQALILTAIVIGFALVNFMAAFVLRRNQEDGSDLIPPTQREGD